MELLLKASAIIVIVAAIFMAGFFFGVKNADHFESGHKQGFSTPRALQY